MIRNVRVGGVKTPIKPEVCDRRPKVRGVPTCTRGESEGRSKEKKIKGVQGEWGRSSLSKKAKQGEKVYPGGKGFGKYPKEDWEVKVEKVRQKKMDTRGQRKNAEGG